MGSVHYLPGVKPPKRAKRTKRAKRDWNSGPFKEKARKLLWLARKRIEAGEITGFAFVALTKKTAVYGVLDIMDERDAIDAARTLEDVIRGESDLQEFTGH